MSCTMAKEAPSFFSSLPNDIVLNVLARVRFHPILSCVSKKLGSLVRSSELRKTRSLMGKDRFYFYVCINGDGRFTSLASYHWFTITENRRLVSVPFPYPPEPYYNALTMGSDIYFVGGSRRMWILDSRSGQLRQGPSSLVASNNVAVGLVNNKIYIFGGTGQKRYYKDIQAQVFDPKTQTWQVAPNPSLRLEYIYASVVTHSLGRKIYVREVGDKSIIVYDTRDGKCDKIVPVEELNSDHICVVDNVIYMHYHDVGLMWYDSKEKEWRLVHVYGLKLGDCFLCNVQMAEYDGKLAFMWQETDKDEIWCAMIALYGSSQVAIQGRVEWSDCLLSQVPLHHNIIHFVVCTDY